MRVYKCDKCGKNFEPEMFTYQFYIPRLKGKNPQIIDTKTLMNLLSESFDVCPNCQNRLFSLLLKFFNED